MLSACSAAWRARLPVAFHAVSCLLAKLPASATTPSCVCALGLCLWGAACFNLTPLAKEPSSNAREKTKERCAQC